MSEITIVSLGAGVQSSALAVLNALGKVEPRASAAVFADTGCEWPETYDFLFGHLKPWLEARGLPVVVVTAGDMYEFLFSKRLLPVTFGNSEKSGRRQCTDRFKIRPMKRWLRGAGARRAVVMLGITIEESHRATPSPDKWITNLYPFVEMGWTRRDCARLLLDMGLPIPPKSRCWICPMQPLDAWRLLAVQHPELFERAAALEERAIARRLAAGKEPLTLTGDRSLRKMFSSSQLCF